MHKIHTLLLLIALAISGGGCATTSVNQEDVDAKVKAYFEKHSGVTLGQLAPSLGRVNPFTMDDGLTEFKNGTVFTVKGKVNRVQIYQDIDKSLPLAEANARVYAELARLAQSFGLDKDYFKRHHVYGHDGRHFYLRDWYKSDGSASPTDILFLIGIDLEDENVGKSKNWRYVIEFNNFGTNTSNADADMHWPPKAELPWNAPMRVSQQEVDASVQAYFEEHSGVSLGQPAPSPNREFPFTMDDGLTGFKNGKSFALNGKINRIQIYQDIDKSLPLAEANAQVYRELARLATAFGLDKDYFKRHHAFGHNERYFYLRDWYKNDGYASPSDILFLIGIDFDGENDETSGTWRYIIEFNNFGTNHLNAEPGTTYFF